MLVTAGVHGDEYPGIAASIRVAGELNPEEMSGNVLFVHCVNVSGFYGKNRRVPEDGGNLNADFPGKRGGTVSEQIEMCIRDRQHIFSHFSYFNTGVDFRCRVCTFHIHP